MSEARFVQVSSFRCRLGMVVLRKPLHVSVLEGEEYVEIHCQLLGLFVKSRKSAESAFEVFLSHLAELYEEGIRSGEPQSAEGFSNRYAEVLFSLIREVEFSS